MKNIINKSFLFTALLNIFICSCSTQNNLDLNLTDISFYKLSLNELTLNEVTDIFGPPTATNNNPLAPDLINIIGVQVYYHNIGLMFWFNPKNSNSEQTLRLLKIHLVKKWDQDYNEFF
ncbi:MAG: hypothetical protein K0B11_18390, partial [Mariniphaga sp.]|nr:hypothetical protein [Mariniphaga sp.]